MINLLLTLMVASITGWVFTKLKIPAGMLVGAIIGVSVLNIIFSAAYMPPTAKLIAQIITGAYIGCMIKKEDLIHFPHIALPFSTIILSFFVLNMIMGFIIYKITSMDLITSMLCAMPGGMSDTPLIAMDMGADVPKVVVLQFIRMVFGVAALPSIIVLVDKFRDRKNSKNTNASQNNLAEKEQPVATKVKAKTNINSLIITLSIASVGGILGNISPIPAGALMFSMVFVLLAKTTVYSKAGLPLWCRRIAQILSGCCIGVKIVRSDILELRYLILPAILLLMGYTINCILVGTFLSKKFKMGTKEGMLCVSPAGATEMALIAMDLGVTSPDLIVIQMLRLLTVLSVFPTIISLVISAFA